MNIYSTLSASELSNIAGSLGITTYNVTDNGVRTHGKYAGKRHVSLTLRPLTERYRARSDSGRRLWAVDWEGHRDFMREVFGSDAGATIDSALARYRGQAEFERLHRLTGSNLGFGYREKVTA